MHVLRCVIFELARFPYGPPNCQVGLYCFYVDELRLSRSLISLPRVTRKEILCHNGFIEVRKFHWHFSQSLRQVLLNQSVPSLHFSHHTLALLQEGIFSSTSVLSLKHYLVHIQCLRSACGTGSIASSSRTGSGVSQSLKGFRA